MMRKILFKSGHTGFGGVETVQAEYINYLYSINANFKVVLDKDLEEQNVMSNMLKSPVVYLKNEKQTTELENAKTNKNKSFLHKIKYNLAINKDRKILKKEFAKVVNAFEPDVTINFHSSYYFNLDVLDGAKNIVWVHSSIVNHWRNLEKGLKYIKKLSEYDLIVCVSQGIANEIIELEPELKHKTTHLYNPINFERINKLSNEDFNDEEKETANEKFLLMVSRFDIASKDYYTLFKAFDIAKENDYDGKLYVIGDGNDEEKAIVNALLDTTKYKNDVKLIGAKVNPFNWMKKCDKFILSTRFEGLPTVLLEALTVNDVVISADCKAGPKEILDKGKHGYLFDVGDYNKLAELIIEAKPKDRKLINEHLKTFSNEVIMQKFHNILTDI